MPPRRLLLPFCAALALPASLAQGQASDFLAALSGSKYPLTVRVKDLNADWRQVSLGDPVHLNIALPEGAPVPPFLGGATQGGRYLTKGQTVTVGSETFLVAYFVPVRYEFFHANERTDWSAAALEKAAREGNDSYALSLLNVRQIISLDNVWASTLPAPVGKVQSRNEHTGTARAAGRPPRHD